MGRSSERFITLLRPYGASEGMPSEARSAKEGRVNLTAAQNGRNA